MKKYTKLTISLSLLVGLLAFSKLSAQSPDKMSYQALVRGVSNEILSEQQIAMRISILQGGSTFTVIYQESHTATTNENGLVTLEIGEGTTEDNFSAIDWSNGDYFIRTEVDLNGGSEFTIIATSQLLSVPYALYSKNAGNVFSGDYNDLTNTPDIPDFDGEFSTLTNIPSGLSDGDDDTQLTETEVDNFVSNNGYLTSEVDGSVTNEIELPDQIDQSGKVLSTDGSSPSWISMSFDNLINIPANLDTDSSDDFDGEFSSLNGIPNGLSDGDDDTQLTETEVDDFVSNNGYLTSEVDGSVTNEIELPDQDDNSGKILSTDGSSPSWITMSYNNLSDLPTNLDTDSSDDFDGVFSSLSGIPTGLSDGDDDTQLTETEVDDYVSNNGYLIAEIDGSVTNEIELPDQSSNSGKILSTDGSSPSWITMSYNNLSDLPTNLDTDSSDDFDGAFSSLSDIPTGLSDGDDDTQLTETEVDDYVSDNGFLTTEVDGSITNEIELPDQSSNSGKILSTDGSSPSWITMSYNNLSDLPTNLDTDSSDDFDGAFSSLSDIPTGLSDGDDDTQLTETEVDDYVSDNGFLTTEVDGSITNEIELPDQSSNSGKILSTDGSSPSWITMSYNNLSDLPSNLDTDSSDDFDGAFSSLSGIPIGLSNGDDDTQLTETEVDNYVSNNGYLTAEVDGSVTNELELPSQTGNNGKYLTTDGTSVSWSTVSGGTRSVTTISSNTTLTSTDEVVIINGAFTATFPSTPVDGQVLILVSTTSSANIHGNGKSLYVDGSIFSSLAFADAITSLYTFIYSSTLDAWMGNY